MQKKYLQFMIYCKWSNVLKLVKFCAGNFLKNLLDFQLFR